MVTILMTKYTVLAVEITIKSLLASLAKILLEKPLNQLKTNRSKTKTWSYKDLSLFRNYANQMMKSKLSQNVTCCIFAPQKKTNYKK